MRFPFIWRSTHDEMLVAKDKYIEHLHGELQASEWERRKLIDAVAVHNRFPVPFKEQVKREAREAGGPKRMNVYQRQKKRTAEEADRVND